MKMKTAVFLLAIAMMFSSCNAAITTDPKDAGTEDWDETAQELVTDYYEKAQKSRKSKTVAATVNGEPIYREEVEQGLAGIKAQCALAEQSSDLSGLTDEQRKATQEKMDAVLSQTYDDQLQQIMRNMIMEQEAKKQGFTVDDDMAYQTAKGNFDTLKTAASDPDANEDIKNNYQLALGYMEAAGMTEEDYIQEVAQMLKRSGLRKQLREDFEARHPDESFESYVDGLVAKADIVYGS